MRAHSRGNRALAVAFFAMLAGVAGVSGGCGTAFSDGADATDAASSTQDGAPAEGSTVDGAASSYCDEQSRQSPVPDLCDSFDDRQSPQDVRGRWPDEVAEGDSSKVALSIDSNVSASKPGSLRVQRVESGSEGAHYLRFEANFERGQTWRLHGKVSTHFQGTSTIPVNFAPFIMRVASAKVSLAHAYFKFDMSADGTTRVVSALRSGASPFAPSESSAMQSWTDSVYIFEIAVTRPVAPGSVPSASLRFDSSIKTFDLTDTPRTLGPATIRIDVGGYTAAGGWDFHVDDVVITHE